MRNPLDVLNSSVKLFSFLGDDYYKSDAERLREEIEEKFNITIDQNLYMIPIYREVTY